MPLKLTVGLSQKVGQPDFGSVGASCCVEVELEPSLLQRDLDGFHRHVQQAFVACRQAVQDELARHQPGDAPNGHAQGDGHSRRNGNGSNGNGHASNGARSNGRRATVSQVRAIHAIAGKLKLDLPAELRQRFGVERPEDLSLSDASALIDELKAAPREWKRSQSMIAAAPPSANATALQLTGRDYVSYSAIASYRGCPLRYFFRYVAGLPEEAVSASLVFGGAIHRAAQRHFEAILVGDELPTLEELFAAYADGWREHDGKQVQFGKGDDRESLDDLAGRMLTAFQASAAASPQGRILGIEEELRGELVPGVPDLLARLDLFVETDDAVVVSDLKTARSRWSRDQIDDSAEQLLLYGELVRRLIPGKAIRLEFTVVTKAKQPVVEQHCVPFDPARVDRTKRIVERVWQAIEAERFYPSPSPMNCSGCPFRDPCRAWPG